ncbi:hypothetical protein [Yoonia sp. SS1-5]|uniref:Murein hydrolase activator EnvC n=1 Tax=Yoonia rhodophyticola TaxID=3137370 RepID=A0AAN0M9I4_9RHOB
MRLAAFLICLAMPLAAQTPEETAAARLEAANAQLQAAQTSGERVAALTETVRAYEEGLAAMRDGLRQIAAREAALKATFDATQDELGELLGALQSVARTPAPVINAHPQGVVAAARAAGVLADLTPALQTRANALRTQIDEIGALRTSREETTARLQAGLIGAQDARSALGLAISERRDLPARFDEDPVQTAILLASTATLAAFTDALTAQLPTAEAALEPAGDLPLPVRGYALPDDGSGRPGVRIAGPANGLVTTPVPATLLFQGPLLDYGTVIILEPAADLLFIFAGLEQTFGTVGQIIPAGSPVGMLGGAAPADDAELSENYAIETGQSTQSLYLEVRQGQSPVNPDAWFALE